MGKESSTFAEVIIRKQFDSLKNRRKYYTPEEVARHYYDDFWVSFFGKVYDLTGLVKKYEEKSKPIVDAAGTDISHWFDKDTHDIQTFISPETGLEIPYTPFGEIPHAAPAGPLNNLDTTFGTPWWFDEETYCIGNLSQSTRKIRVVNTLTKQEHIVEVCVEESLSEIRDRYLPFNFHGHSYTWKRLGKDLDMEKTLEENGLPDESEKYVELDLVEDFYIPTIHIYFDDNLTVA